MNKEDKHERKFKPYKERLERMMSAHERALSFHEAELSAHEAALERWDENYAAEQK